MSTLIPGSRLEKNKKGGKNIRLNHFFINSPRRKRY
jgi:hypothetical protein